MHRLNHPCVWKNVFGSFLTKTMQDQALSSHVNGKVLPHSTQFCLGFFFLLVNILGTSCRKHFKYLYKWSCITDSLVVALYSSFIVAFVFSMLVNQLNFVIFQRQSALVQTSAPVDENRPTAELFPLRFVHIDLSLLGTKVSH